MNKKFILGFIISGGCLLLGLIILLFVLIANDFNLTKLSNEEYEAKTYTSVDTSFSNINIDIRTIDVTFESTDSTNISLSYDENEKNSIIIKEEAGTLIIKSAPYKWYEYIFQFDFNFKKPKMTISIPSTYNGKIDTEIDNGNVIMNNMTFVDSIKIDLDNGDVKLDNCTYTNFYSETSNGDYIIKNTTFNDFTGDTDNGYFQLSEIIANNLICETDNGKIYLEECSATVKIDCKSSNGRIELKYVSCNSAISCKTSNGAIVLTEVNPGSSIVLKTSNGAIRGSVMGAMDIYTIVSSTGNGDNSLPSNKTTGTRSMSAKTSNGDINITFISIIE